MIDDEVLRRLAKMRRLVLEHYRADSCIATVRVALAVLSRFEIPAMPVMAELVARNPPLVTAMESGLPEVKAIQQPGTWSVGVGLGGDPRGRLPIHVVVLLDDWLLDPSLDQVSRPQHAMAFEAPGLFELDADSRSELMTGEFVSWHRDGSVLTYHLRPHDLRYQISPNWGPRDAGIRAEILEKTMRGDA